MSESGGKWCEVVQFTYLVVMKNVYGRIPTFY